MKEPGPIPGKFRQTLLQWLLTGMAKLPLGLLQSLGSGIGTILLLTRSRLALVTEENIQLCFPEMSAAEQRRLIAASLKETGKTILESVWAWYGPASDCEAAIVAVEGEQAVTAALAEGQSVIILLPHLGNWEVANHYLGNRYALTHMYQPNKSATFETLVQTGRMRTGTQFVPANAQGVRAQLRVLHSGGVIGSMPDQEPLVHQGEFVPFFGVKALTSGLIPALSERTNATTVVCYCQRLDHAAGYKLQFRQTDHNGQQPLTASGMNQAIEQAIRECPQQYLWSYKRFRTRPAFEPELYQLQDNPVKAFLEQSLVSCALRLVRLFPVTIRNSLSQLLYASIRFANGKHVRVARRNIAVTEPHNLPPQKLLQRSLRHLAETCVELGSHWYDEDAEFESRLLTVQGNEYLGSSAGTIVLTPPLGYREVVMRYLGQHFKTTEYYHPASRTGIDRLIRHTRTAMGIALVPHSERGLAILVEQLNKGATVTLCPDQQPRLRGGEFVDFFGVPALTTTAISTLCEQTGATLVIAVALPRGHGVDLHFELCPPKPDLQSINAQLQTTILNHEDKYRWSDKRFNIQPPGSPRFYQ